MLDPFTLQVAPALRVEIRLGKYTRDTGMILELLDYDPEVEPAGFGRGKGPRELFVCKARDSPLLRRETDIDSQID